MRTTTSTTTLGPHGIDLTAPGGIDALLDFHRATFGDAVMEATGEAGAAAAGGTDPAADDAAAQGATVAAAAAAASSGEGLPDDAAALKAMIADLRRENASARTGAKTKAADDARNALAQEIGKALGLVKTGETPDPAQLAAQVAESQATARSALVELAVFKAATPLGGDPARLLDSRTFLAKVTDLDPTKGDFGTKVDAAIKAALIENPTLKAVQATGASSVDHTGGTGERSAQPTTIAAAVQQHYGA